MQCQCAAHGDNSCGATIEKGLLCGYCLSGHVIIERREVEVPVSVRCGWFCSKHGRDGKSPIEGDLRCDCPTAGPSVFGRNIEWATIDREKNTAAVARAVSANESVLGQETRQRLMDRIARDEEDKRVLAHALTKCLRELEGWRSLDDAECIEVARVALARVGAP